MDNFKKQGRTMAAVAALAMFCTLMFSLLGREAKALGRTLTLRAASGDLTVADITTGVDMGNLATVVVTLNVTTLTVPDADDVVDFWLQTTYDDGVTWIDVENANYVTGDTGTTPTLIFFVDAHDITGVVGALTPTDGALAADTKAKFPLGDQLRWKTAVAGATAPTYAYNSTAWLRRN